MNFIAAGAADVAGGFASWRMWWMLAKNDVARRYRRSRIGQLWLTLSMAVMIFGLGIVYSGLFNTPMAAYLPHLAAGLVLWGLIASVLQESCTAFIDNEGIIKQIALPRFTYLLRALSRNIFVFAHNFVLIPLVCLLTGTPITAAILLFVPGLLLVLVNLAWMGYVLAIVSTRFRDIPQIVQSVVQIMFFVSPVVFRASQLAADHPVILLNPFAAMLDVMRAPLLGDMPALYSFGFLVVMALLGWGLALDFAGRYARRVVYWL